MQREEALRRLARQRPRINSFENVVEAANRPTRSSDFDDDYEDYYQDPFAVFNEPRLVDYQEDDEDVFFGRRLHRDLFAFPSLRPTPRFLQVGKEDANMLSAARDTSQHELSPKAKVTYDEAKFQVEFDVQDYRPEELSIKTEGDVLIVLAKHETKTENGGSFVSKQFEQRFTLPSGVKPESITSSLSKDGTLTVTAPREVPQGAGFKRLEQSNGGPNANAVYAHSNNDQEEGLPHPKVKYDDDKFQISLDCHKYKPEELDVKVEGSTIIITAKQESKEAGGTRTRVFEQKFTLPSGVKAEKVTSTFSRDGYLTITAPRGQGSIAGPTSTSTSTPTSNIEQRMDKVLSPSNWDNNFSSSSSTSSSRHHFGGDLDRRFGGDLDHFGPQKSIFDREPALYPMSGFSNAPSGVGSGDGISKVKLTDDEYRILVNVDGFEPEELIIKTVGNTVHFEAKHEEKTSDGHSFTSRNISQSFTLPRGVDPESVTSSLSKEGVLTIAAPLPAALKVQSHERLVPIKHR